jgi:hypothetical protein
MTQSSGQKGTAEARAKQGPSFRMASFMFSMVTKISFRVGFLLGLIFDPEDGDDMSSRKVGYSVNYVEL